MIGRRMPMRTGAAMRSQTATVTRRVMRSEDASDAVSVAMWPSAIKWQLRRRRRVPTRPVAVMMKVIGVPMSQSQGRYWKAVVMTEASGWGLGAGGWGVEIANVGIVVVAWFVSCWFGCD